LSPKDMAITIFLANWEEVEEEEGLWTSR